MKSLNYNKENAQLLSTEIMNAGRKLSVEMLIKKNEALAKAELILSGKGASNVHSELIAAGAKFVKSRRHYKINAFDFEFAVRVTKSINPAYITKSLK